MKQFILILTITTIVVLLMMNFCTGYQDLDLGGGYGLVYEGVYTASIVNAQNDEVVQTVILDYAFDSTFIIACRRPWNVPGVPGLRDMTYDERREAFVNSTYREYWIINKKEKNEAVLDSSGWFDHDSNVYGPYKKQQYLQKREELGVPRELKLKEE